MSPERPERHWGRAAYSVGFASFAIGFVGMAISVTTGNELLVIACIVVVAVGGIMAGVGFHQMFGKELRQAWGSDPGEDGDDRGGWGRGPDPEETPPESGGSPLGEDEQPAWWPAFEHALNGWMLEDAAGPVTPEGLTEP